MKIYAPDWRYNCLSDNKLLSFWGCARRPSFSSTLPHSRSPNAVPLNSTKDFCPPDSMMSWYWHQRADERRGIGVSGLTRGLATLPQGGSRSLRWSETGMEDPQEDPLAVHCFCVCSGSVLLGDLLVVNRSRECDLPSILSIYPRIFLCVFIVYRRVVRILCVCCILLYVDVCWLLWFSCQYLPSDWLERLL